MDANTKRLLNDAANAATTIDDILGRAASGGARSKPTIADLNRISELTLLIRTRLAAALGDR